MFGYIIALQVDSYKHHKDLGPERGWGNESQTGAKLFYEKPTVFQVTLELRCSFNSSSVLDACGYPGSINMHA